MKAAILIAVMAAVTVLTRSLPFLAFRKKTPSYVAYLGRVLPSAIIGMLVIYCFKDVTPGTQPFGLPELIAAVCTAAVQAWKRNIMLSIVIGTAAYMILIRVL